MQSNAHGGNKLIKTALASSQVGPNIEQNFLTVAGIVKQVAGEKTQLICFPECTLGGLFEIDNYQAAKDLAIEIPGQITERVARLATVYDVYIAIGLLEQEGPRIYDSAVLFSDTGEIILKHRRINPCWRDGLLNKEI
jgi:predicted amidohydrolase